MYLTDQLSVLRIRTPMHVRTVWLAMATLTAFAITDYWSCEMAVAQGVAQDSIPPRIEEFLQRCETSRKGAIAQLEFELRGLRNQRGISPAESRRVKTIESHLDSLRANKEPVVPALHFPPEVGDIGRLPQLTCHVDQVIGAERMLVTCNFSLKVRAVRNFQPRLETVTRPVTLLIEGLATNQFTEGADVPLLDVFEITGEHTYRSVSGKQITVLVLSPFDMKAIEPYFRAMTSRQ